MEDIAVDVQRPRCPYCHDEVIPGEGRGCADCMGWTHDECWVEHGSCPACGAASSLSANPAPVQKPAEKPAAETPAELAERAAQDAGQRSSNLILGGILFVVLVGTLATLVVMMLAF